MSFQLFCFVKREIPKVVVVVNVGVRAVCPDAVEGYRCWQNAPCGRRNAWALFMLCLSASLGQGLWEVQGFTESVYQTKGVTRQVGERLPPPMNQVFIAAVYWPLLVICFMMTDISSPPPPFQLHYSDVLHVWMSSSSPSCTSPSNKGASFAWIPGWALLIDLRPD